MCSASVTGPGSVPEWPKGADCKSAGIAYGGSNPPRPTTPPATRSGPLERVDQLAVQDLGRWPDLSAGGRGAEPLVTPRCREPACRRQRWAAGSPPALGGSPVVITDYGRRVPVGDSHRSRHRRQGRALTSAQAPRGGPAEPTRSRRRRNAGEAEDESGDGRRPGSRRRRRRRWRLRPDRPRPARSGRIRL